MLLAGTDQVASAVVADGWRTTEETVQAIQDPNFFLFADEVVSTLHRAAHADMKDARYPALRLWCLTAAYQVFLCEKSQYKIEGTAAVKSLLTIVCIPVPVSVNTEYSAAWRGWQKQCQRHQIQTSFKIFAQPKSCWSSQQSAKKSEDKARANWQNFCSSPYVCCEPLQVFSLRTKVCCLQSLSSVTGQLVKASML